MFEFVKKWINKNKQIKSDLELEIEEKVNRANNLLNRAKNIGYFNPYDFAIHSGVKFNTNYHNIVRFNKFLSTLLKDRENIEYINTSVIVSNITTFFLTEQGGTLVSPREEFIKLVTYYRDIRILSINLDYKLEGEQDHYFVRKVTPFLNNLENIILSILQHTC